MSVTNEVAEWTQTGAALLAKIEDEQKAKATQVRVLQAEIAALEASALQIKAMLASLPVSKPQKAPSAGSVAAALGVFIGKQIVERNGYLHRVDLPVTASVVDAVRGVLKVSDHPLSARAIYDGVSGIRAVTVEDVHRAIYRLKEGDEIVVSGERPNRLYSLKEAQTAIPMAK